MRVPGTGGWRGSFVAVFAGVVALPFGCSGDDGPSGGRAGNGALGGAGGDAGSTGGTSTNSGASGRAAGSTSVAGRGAAGTASGQAGMAAGETGGGNGGAGAGGPTSEAGEGGLGGASACDDLQVTPTVVPSTVTLLVDNSSSMFQAEPSPWSQLYAALMDPVTGVVEALESKIRFGFAAYRGATVPSAEDDPACAAWTTVQPGIDNRETIDAAYSAIAWPIEMPTWETPTGHAVRKAATDLSTDPTPGQKLILLVTDGNPNTCEVLDPQCGQDNSIHAVQTAFAAGIRLFVVGIGDIVAAPNAGCPTSARCGSLHLQDLANAGIGAPVRPPPGCDDPTAASCIFRFEQCNQGQVLSATYTPDAPDVGDPLELDTTTSPTPAALAAAIIGALEEAVSCTIDLDVTVTGDPADLDVVVDGTPAPFEGSPRGFSLDPNQHAITLTGTACDDFRDGAPLAINVRCDSVTGRIAMSQ
jgi:hypothetical protein